MINAIIVYINDHKWGKKMENMTAENQLVKLILTINMKPEECNYNKTSSFHGALMEIIDEDYAEFLHEQGLKPYSQHLQVEDDKVTWHINALSAEAYRKIIEPVLDKNFIEFRLEHDDRTIRILDKKLQSCSLDELFQDFYANDAANIFRIVFLTPTAFKKDGKYSFYPEIYNIYQSLMRRFDEVSDRGNMFSQNTLEQLTESTEVVGYSLRSVKFSLEKVRIPAFVGSITLKIHGAQTMCNFARLLFEFGNYSGIGIKTAIGMGSVNITERRRTDNDRAGSETGSRRPIT